MYSPAYLESSLSPLATRSRESRGRSAEEKECDLRTVFQRDRDRIIHSKSFRRLKHKAQVFIAPKGDHFRTRLTHTLEVMQIARTIARILRLNEDLTEAIALGHDLGHTPFGHAGERSLRLIDADFSHNRQSLRVADVLERNGRGLNLTYEVKDGILRHSGEDGLPETFEGSVVRISDRIAYINHDIDDALRAGLISMADLPKGALSILGETHGERIDTLVRDMARYGLDNGEAGMTEPVAEAMDALRRFLFNAVYKRPAAFADEERVREMLGCLYRYYSEHPWEMIMDYTDPNLHRAVCDYISGMTDIYALNRYEFIKNAP